jgi:hypothetical protein
MRLRLKSMCTNCCDNNGNIIQVNKYFELSNEQVQSEGLTWFHVGGATVEQWYTCNMKSCCNKCVSSCAVTFRLSDKWHWSIPIHRVRTGPDGKVLVTRLFSTFWFETVWNELHSVESECRRAYAP